MQDDFYKIIKNEKSFSGKIIDVFSQTIVLPDGKHAVREIVKRGEAVAVVPVDNEGNVILVQQYRPAALKEIFEIPAGMVEEGEDIEKAAARELEEETSFIPKNLKYVLTAYPAIGFCTEKIHIFMSQGLEQGEFNFDDDEFITVHKVKYEDAINMIYNGEIIDLKTISGLLACKDLIKL